MKTRSHHTQCQFGASFEAICRAAVIAAMIETYLKEGK